MYLVTLQAQKEYPPDMLCKDKFLLQSTIVNSDNEELPSDTVRILCRRESGILYLQREQSSSDFVILVLLFFGKLSILLLIYLVVFSLTRKVEEL